MGCKASTKRSSSMLIGMLGFIKRFVGYISLAVGAEKTQKKQGMPPVNMLQHFDHVSYTFLHYMLRSLTSIHCRVWRMTHTLLVRTAIRAVNLLPDSAFLAKFWLNGSEGRSAEDIKGWRSQLIGKIYVVVVDVRLTHGPSIVYFLEELVEHVKELPKKTVKRMVRTIDFV